jgi:glutamate-1-semialdehyde 2,1-aminomutase
MSFEVASRNIANFYHRGRRLQLDSGSGPWLFEADGTRWLDLVGGYGPIVIGHSDPEFLTLTSDHMAKGLQFASYSTLHEMYAEGLPDIWPTGSCAFFKTSSEAVTAAVRISSRMTSKRGVVRCGFTGWHDVQQSPRIAWHLMPRSPDRVRRFVPDMTLRGVSGDEAVFDWVDLRPASLEELLSMHGSLIGTVVVDTYQEELTDIELIRTTVDLCRRHDVTIVLDETKTSGRVAEMGFTEQKSLQPDMVVAGKAIANGAPLSLLLLPRHLGRYVAESRVGGTHSKERFGVAAAVVTRELMSRRQGYEIFPDLGKTWEITFRRAIESLDLSNRVTVHSVLGGAGLDLRLTAPDDTHDGRSVLQGAFATQGILSLVGHPNFLTLAHTQVDLGWLDRRVSDALLRWRTSIGQRT